MTAAVLGLRLDSTYEGQAAMELEAAERYEEFAKEMDRYGNEEAAALFRDLAKDERAHGAYVEKWASRLGRPAPRPLQVRWVMPETFTREQLAEAGGHHLLTPHKALVIATANEERAFRFYVDVGARCEDEDVRRKAESLAKEEINHVARLRLARRRAFRAERRAKTLAALGREAKEIQTLPELLRAARRLEAKAAARDKMAAAALRSPQPAQGARGEAAALLQEFTARVPRQRGTPVENAYVGMEIDNPAPDFGAIARGFGWHGEGPISDPAGIAPAVRKAAGLVLEGGRPALVDVVCQPK